MALLIKLKTVVKADVCDVSDEIKVRLKVMNMKRAVSASMPNKMRLFRRPFTAPQPMVRRFIQLPILAQAALKF